MEYSSTTNASPSPQFTEWELSDSRSPDSFGHTIRDTFISCADSGAPISGSSRSAFHKMVDECVSHHNLYFDSSEIPNTSHFSSLNSSVLSNSTTINPHGIQICCPDVKLRLSDARRFLEENDSTPVFSDLVNLLTGIDIPEDPGTGNSDFPGIYSSTPLGERNTSLPNTFPGKSDSPRLPTFFDPVYRETTYGEIPTDPKKTKMYRFIQLEEVVALIASVVRVFNNPRALVQGVPAVDEVLKRWSKEYGGSSRMLNNIYYIKESANVVEERTYPRRRRRNRRKTNVDDTSSSLSGDIYGEVDDCGFYDEELPYSEDDDNNGNMSDYETGSDIISHFDVSFLDEDLPEVSAKDKSEYPSRRSKKPKRAPRKTYFYLATKADIYAMFAGAVSGSHHTSYDTRPLRVIYKGIQFGISLPFLVTTIAEHVCAFHRYVTHPEGVDCLIYGKYRGLEPFTLYSFPLFTSCHTLAHMLNGAYQEPPTIMVKVDEKIQVTQTSATSFTQTHDSIDAFVDANAIRTSEIPVHFQSEGHVEKMLDHPFWSPDRRYYEPLVYHIHHVLCNDDPVAIRAFETWLAELVFSPYERYPACFVITGPQGVGKNIVIDFIMHFILGSSCTITITDFQRITGRFNGILSKKLLIMINEEDLNTKDEHVLQTLKSLCTDGKGQSMELKFGEQHGANFHTRFVIVTNDPKPYEKLTVGERRFFIIKTTSNIPSTRYFDTLSRLLKDPQHAPTTAAHFIGYLRAIRHNGILPDSPPRIHEIQPKDTKTTATQLHDSYLNSNTELYRIPVNRQFKSPVPVKYLHTKVDLGAEILLGSTKTRYSRYILRRPIVTTFMVEQLLAKMTTAEWFLYGMVVHEYGPVTVMACIIMQQSLTCPNVDLTVLREFISELFRVGTLSESFACDIANVNVVDIQEKYSTFREQIDILRDFLTRTTGKKGIETTQFSSPHSSLSIESPEHLSSATKKPRMEYRTKRTETSASHYRRNPVNARKSSFDDFLSVQSRSDSIYSSLLEPQIGDPPCLPSLFSNYSTTDDDSTAYFSSPARSRAPESEDDLEHTSGATSSTAHTYKRRFGDVALSFQSQAHHGTAEIAMTGKTNIVLNGVELQNVIHDLSKKYLAKAHTSGKKRKRYEQTIAEANGLGRGDNIIYPVPKKTRGRPKKTIIDPLVTPKGVTPDQMKEVTPTLPPAKAKIAQIVFYRKTDEEKNPIYNLTWLKDAFGYKYGQALMTYLDRQLSHASGEDLSLLEMEDK